MLKKLIILSMLMALVIAGAVSVQRLWAGALVINDQGCLMLDGNGNLVLADSDQRVITPSDNGKITCKASVVPPADGKAVKFNYDNTGLTCNIPGAGSTTDWQETVSASGKATLQCRIHP